MRRCSRLASRAGLQGCSGAMEYYTAQGLSVCWWHNALDRPGSVKTWYFHLEAHFGFISYQWASPTAEVNRSAPLLPPIPIDLPQEPGPHLVKAYAFTKGREGRAPVRDTGRLDRWRGWGHCSEACGVTASESWWCVGGSMQQQWHPGKWTGGRGWVWQTPLLEAVCLWLAYRSGSFGINAKVAAVMSAG